MRVRISISLPSTTVDYIDSFTKKHKLTRLKKGKIEADISKGIDKMIECFIGLTEECKEKDKQIENLNDMVAYLKEHLPQELSSIDEAPTPATQELSEKPCHFTVYIKNKPVCADPDAPIDSYLKRQLNAQICAICQELKKKRLEEVMRKQEQNIKKFYEQKKREASRLQQSVNRTINNQKKSSDAYEQQGVINDPKNTFGHWTEATEEDFS